MTTKNLYFNLSDNVELSNLTIGTLEGVMEYIASDIQYSLESKEEVKEYKVSPTWLTEEEFLGLPEYQF